MFASALKRPLHAALIAICVLATLLGIGVGAAVVVHLRGPDPTRPTLAAAFRELDAKRFEGAREISEKLLTDKSLPESERGGLLLVLGTTVVHEAQEAFNPERKRELYLLAARHLADADACGFPEDRTKVAEYLLATSEFHAKNFASSIPLLKTALQSSPEKKTELAGMLAKACLRTSPLRLKEAFKYNQILLADQKLPPPNRQAGLLEQAQIQFLLNDSEACEKTLELIPPETKVLTGVKVLKARLLLRESEAIQAGLEPTEAELARSQELCKEAETLLSGVPVGKGVADPATRESQYLLGMSLLKQGNLRAAETQFSRTRRLHRDSPEALAALLEEADLKRIDGKHSDAKTAYLDVVSEAGEQASYFNPWVSLQELQARLGKAVEGFRETGEFETASSLAIALPPLVPAARSAELLAEVEEAWAKSLAKQAERATAAERVKLAAKSREKHRDAGAAFGRLAELRKAEREYPDDIWRSAQNFAAGQDYRHALILLKTYLAEESRKRRSEALVALGQCYLALNKLDLAVKPLLECVENFRKQPDSYRARLIAAHAFAEQNELERAKTLLLDNLENESLTPGSLEWRDSLFALGKLLHREATELETQSRKKGVDSPYPDVVKVGLKELEKSHGVFQDAATRLSEAVQRYPEAPQALEARYLLAESHRQSAKWPRKLRTAVAIETTRATLQKQAHTDLNAALAEYEPLLNLLIERQEKSGLSPVETALLRNCYYARADVLFDLERFDDAIAAYSSATNRYHDRPEALEAFVQIASCYRRMNRPAEARGTLEQAKVVLRRIPADAAFTQTTRYDRGEWTQLLNWLSSL